MKHAQDDLQLRRVLATWTVSPPPAPDFKKNVWQRIAVEEERASRTLGMRLRDWFLLELPRPAYAAALLVVAALLGTVAAGVRAEHMRSQHRLESARQYLASINPISMAAQMPHASR